MSAYKTLLPFCTMLLLASCQAVKQAQKVDWLGWPVWAGPYTGVDPGFFGPYPPPTGYYSTNIEIGLRTDGVVVWRERGSKGHRDK